MFSASVKQGARVHKLPRGPGLALGGPDIHRLFMTVKQVLTIQNDMETGSN